MHSVGSIMLEKLLNADGGDYRGHSIPCDDGHMYEFMGYRDKELLTVLGEVKIKRAYYYDRRCNVGFCPKDRSLDIEGTSFSAGVRRMTGRVGAHRAFGLGHEDIKELAGIDVNAKEVERLSEQLGMEAEGFFKKEAEVSLSDKVIPMMKPIPKMYICMDGTGVPVVKAETVGREGKAGEQAKTREAKLGCVFTQTSVDKKGNPVRDEDSTTYVGRIENAEEFGPKLYAEARRRGLQRAQHVSVIGDGALWIWNIAEEHFYGATQIVDLFHARQHYWTVARELFINEKKMNEWTEKRRNELNDGNVEAVITAIKKLKPSTEHKRKLCEKEANFFEKNKERMRYAEFKKQGLFVGSGVLEAGCKTVIGQRLKQSGMHWSVKGANSIIALRCCLLSKRWEDFWESRACA